MIKLSLINKINKKKDIIIFIDSNRKEILKRVKKRKNFNNKVLQKLRHLQLPNKLKKKNLIMLLKIHSTKIWLEKKLSLY